MSSILREDQYFNNEADFCVVWNEDSLKKIERIFLSERISYFITDEKMSILQRLFGPGRRTPGVLVRINGRDMARASELVSALPDVEIVGEIPAQDWSPKEKIRRMREREFEEMYGTPAPPEAESPGTGGGMGPGGRGSAEDGADRE